MALLRSHSSNATPMSNDQGVRLDQWLFAARFFKTRHLASEAARRNHIVVNQQRAKPGKRVFTADRVEIRKGPLTYDIEIINLAEKRLAPALAAALYQEDDDSCERRRLRQAELQQQRNVGVTPGRPDKRQRRQLTKFRNL
jgi:ribosome-associated heat shock protein Hsp15